MLCFFTRKLTFFYIFLKVYLTQSSVVFFLSFFYFLIWFVRHQDSKGDEGYAWNDLSCRCPLIWNASWALGGLSVSSWPNSQYFQNSLLGKITLDWQRQPAAKPAPVEEKRSVGRRRRWGVSDFSIRNGAGTGAGLPNGAGSVLGCWSGLIARHTSHKVLDGPWLVGFFFLFLSSSSVSPSALYILAISNGLYASSAGGNRSLFGRSSVQEGVSLRKIALSGTWGSPV